MIRLCLILFIYFECVSLNAQELYNKKHSVEFHIAEPWMLMYTRKLQDKGQWYATAGIGFMGIFNTVDFSKRYNQHPDYFTFHRDVYVLDAAVRKYFSFHENRKWGILLQSGMQIRAMPWMPTDFRNPRTGAMAMYVRKGWDFDVIPYFRGGIYFRPGARTEFGFSAGLGYNVYPIPNMTDLWDGLGSVYVRFALGKN